MALLNSPQFKSSSYRDFDIDMPGSGGVNLKDLQFELDVNQSPSMLNMFYKNGHLRKRYGQEEWYSFANESQIDAIGYYSGDVFVATDGAIYKGNPEEKNFTKLIEDNRINGKSKLINFGRNLYFWNSEAFLVYDKDNNTFKEVELYVPDVVINRKPDGTYSDPMDNYNRLSPAFKNSFHSDGESKVYVLSTKGLDNKTPIVEVINGTVPEFTFDAKEGTVTFNTAPVKGTNNVVITAYKTEKEYELSITRCTFTHAYGGNNNSRLFVGGGGDGMIYYSDVSDITYFPDNNDFRVGNDEDDVTGFGEQYDVLMVFKPREIYSLEYYIDANGLGAFAMKLVNAEIGCDAPKTIQLINNQLTWLSTIVGVCTLVSTAIEDERNVRIISRNIEGGYRFRGLMQEANLKDAISVDYDNKYMLAVNGKVYLWDYLMAPYSNTGRLDQDAKRLAWFIFDNMNIENYIKTSDNLFYTNKSKIIKLTDHLNDFGEPINAHYQTPYLQFNAVTYLKTVKNLYVQTLADNAVQIDMTYFTEETPSGEKEPEPIRVYGMIWNAFVWNAFGWQFKQMVNTYRRKCSLKKIQMCSVLFENNEVDKDMAISHIGFQYMIVKNIK